MKKLFHVHAAAATELDTIKASDAVSAIGQLPENGSSEIQWMPPGLSTINASINGKPGLVKVNATAATAELVNTRLQAMHAAAKAGDSVEPYLDFDHKDEEASGTPISAHWGGDDPKTGGVRVKVEWSDAGRAKVKGKSYRSFSPEFKLTKAGDVADVGLNLGGLVNRPAFTRIAKVSAKAESGAGGTPEEENQPAPGANPYMKELLKVMAKQGLISSSELSEAEAIGEMSSRGPEIKEALKVQAKLTTDYVPKADHDALQARHAALLGTNADHVIASAVKDGRIAPKDDKVQARFKKLLVDDPSNIELIDALPITKVPGQIVKASGADRGTGSVESGEAAGDFMGLVKAKAAEMKISEVDAMSVVARANPDSYKAYTDGIGVKK